MSNYYCNLNMAIKRISSIVPIYFNSPRVVPWLVPEATTAHPHPFGHLMILCSVTGIATYDEFKPILLYWYEDSIYHSFSYILFILTTMSSRLDPNRSRGPEELIHGAATRRDNNGAEPKSKDDDICESLLYSNLSEYLIFSILTCA
jgi:hypothetical protein